MPRARTLLFGGAALCLSSSAYAGDTVTYTYDTLGRLVATGTSGGPNAGVSTGTTFDPAGNRSSYSVSGAATYARSAQTAATTSTATKVPAGPIPVFVLADR